MSGLQLALRGSLVTTPGIATAHSHAFQRGLRGRLQTGGSFWNWRDGMYRFVQALDPDAIFSLGRYAFCELATCGVTAVGEFHYIHRDPSGKPYADPNACADALIEAALEVGIRITLLRAFYERGGPGQLPEGAQLRFCDASLEEGMRLTEALVERWKHEDRVRIGVALHSVRALTARSIREIVPWARQLGLPIHMHVAEQPKEVALCLSEHGRRPVELLEEMGVLGPDFTAIHAIYLEPHEIQMLGRARSYVCICRSTERDLADGAPWVSELLKAGARVVVGVDGYAASDPFEEVRAIEWDERTRRLVRGAALDGMSMWQVLTTEGHASIGWSKVPQGDEVEINLNDPGIDVDPQRDPQWEGVLAWQVNCRAVRQVRVGGRLIVQDGKHCCYDNFRSAYQRTLQRVWESM
ncbi:MAG: formimidoylglutamate deiminase [Sandaracinaceae bacterium]|nr:formimidoylglutamate deiminase [Sandaracinaceae bacterium]